MTKEDKLRAQMSRAEHAKRLLEDGLIKEFFDKAEAEALAIWPNSKIDEKDLREDAYLTYQVIQRLKSCFSMTIANGKFARDELFRTEGEK